MKELNKDIVKEVFKFYLENHFPDKTLARYAKVKTGSTETRANANAKIDKIYAERDVASKELEKIIDGSENWELVNTWPRDKENQ